MELIIKRFELRKLDRICNNEGCQKPPSKKTTILENDTETGDRKELVMLHLCTHHLEGLKRFLRDLDELTEGKKTITTETIDTGYITH